MSKAVLFFRLGIHLKATLFTIIALVAFAANSLLCRLALAQGYIDAWNFTVIRLLSGAVCSIKLETLTTLKKKGAHIAPFFLLIKTSRLDV